MHNKSTGRATTETEELQVQSQELFWATQTILDGGRHQEDTKLAEIECKSVKGG